MNTTASKRINRVHVRASIYILAVPVLLLYTLVLCGSISVSPGIPKIFLARIQLAQGFKDGRVQFGYFALCAENLSVSKSLTCMPSYSASVDTLSAALLGQVDINQNSTTKFESFNSIADTTTSVRSLVNVALDLQRHILVSPFVAGGILFFAAITTLLSVKLYERSGTTPEKLASSQRKISYLVPITLFFAWLSTIVAFTGALLTTEAITSLRFVTERDGGNLVVSTGTALGVVQWLISGLGFLFALGVTVMLRSVNPMSPGAPPAYSKAGPIARPGPAGGPIRGPLTAVGRGPAAAGRGPPGAGRGPPGSGS